MLRLLLFYEYRARMIVVEHIICFSVCESKEGGGGEKVRKRKKKREMG